MGAGLRPPPSGNCTPSSLEAEGRVEGAEVGAGLSAARLDDVAGTAQRACRRNSAAADALVDEYALIRELLSARLAAGLTQEAVARSMGATKSVVSRLEATGKHSPSLRTLKRYVSVVGCHLEIRLVPNASRPTEASGR